MLETNELFLSGYKESLIRPDSFMMTEKSYYYYPKNSIYSANNAPEIKCINISRHIIH